MAFTRLSRALSLPRAKPLRVGKCTRSRFFFFFFFAMFIYESFELNDSVVGGVMRKHRLQAHGQLPGAQMGAGLGGAGHVPTVVSRAES